MELNYLEIVLNGWVNNRTHLDKYFFRQFKKAEKEFFDSVEFFDGCLRVIEAFDKDLESQVFERKNEIYLMLSLAKSESGDTLDIRDQNSIVQKVNKEEHNKQLKTELETIDKSWRNVHLHSFTKGVFVGHLTDNDILFIKNAIDKTALLVNEKHLVIEQKKIENLDFVDKNENILELTEANLIKCGLDAKYFNSDSGEIYFGDFIVSYTDNKIYPIILKYKQSYNGNETPMFPFKALYLIPDFYKCKLNIYLNQRKNLLASTFIEVAETNLFKQSEINHCEQVIDYYSTLFRNAPHILKKHSAVIGKQAYKTWLEHQSQSIDKSKEIADFLEPKYILGLNEAQISKSYLYFKDYFKPILSYKDYLDCFNENETPKHPKFITGKNKIFVLFLCEAGIKQRIAEDRFGITSFATTKSRNENENQVSAKIVNEIQSLLKL